MTDRLSADVGDILVWGVRESFCRYVLGSSGTITGTACRPDSPAGPFVFGGAGSGPGRPGERVFPGWVRFVAHGGMMNLPLIHPGILRDEHAHLTVADPAAPEDHDRRVRIAVLGLPPAGQDETWESTGPRGWKDVPVQLTESGAILFGGSYEAGAEMAPLTFTEGAGTS